MKVTTVSEMRAMDREAVEKYGIPELMLMENAGQAAFSVLSKEIPIEGKTILVFCGSGNNGGDGFVVARKIYSNGGRVKVFILGDRKKIKGISKTNLDILEKLAVDIKEVRSQEEIRFDTAHCDAMVDAILGTGLSKDVRGHYGEIIKMMNNSGKPILSLDIPSGVNGDTGKIMGIAVESDWTVTFGLPKLGNLLYPGFEMGGQLFVTHISFPPEMTSSGQLKISTTPPIHLPARIPDGHKGDFGDVLFIAGASSYYGAPYFAALSFLKAGGGYSRLAAPASMTPFIANRASEVVFVPQQETAAGSIALQNEKSLMALAEKTDMIVMGPGLSLDAETRKLVLRLVNNIEKPLILDGDGITAVCDAPDIIRTRTAETVLTPHLGEMARIARKPISKIDEDKVTILQETAAHLNAHIVLKGAHSLIGEPDGRVYINTSGNSGMATAGSGDILAGTIPAMAALGLSIPEAVRKGVFIHGLAGDLAAESVGMDGMTAEDIMSHLPMAVSKDRTGLEEKFGDRYIGVRLV